VLLAWWLVVSNGHSNSYKDTAPPEGGTPNEEGACKRRRRGTQAEDWEAGFIRGFTRTHGTL
jgi:hypothetical protein